MGRIAKALKKSAQERQAALLPKLTRADRVVLISYNRETGHLLNPDTATGMLDNHGMEKLKKSGTLQRLLDLELIFPDGKLTPKGLAECKYLKKVIQAREPAVENNIKIKEQIIEDIDTDGVTIELEEEVEPVKPSGVLETSTKKIVSFIPHKTDHKEVEEDPSQVPGPDTSVDDKWLYKNLVSLLDPQSYEAEQFKMLRNIILFPVAGVTPRSILITSALPGDGKSFVSANLAVSIAMNINKHVLLVDCDLRKPDLHRVFGFGDVPGLSDYLVEHRSLDSLLLKTTVEKLTLLPGGPIPSNPSELTSSERMSAMLEEVKHRYQDRLIVIDSPPPGLAAETSFLARQVDGILLVVKYGKTPREEVEDLKITLGSEKILGVVINYLDTPLSKRYGYGKYGKYGGYGSGKKVKIR